MRCEHCFEWDNLNQRETFTREQLVQIVDLYQRQGVNQIHFAGGEPLARLRDLIEVIVFARAKSDCYVVTSGFNLTWENALPLKIAGCKGVIVSIDHYLADRHDRFRHHAGIFDQAVAGVRASVEAGMVTAVSVCATREFIERRVGCYSGSRSVYIDSAGDVHACPFCHTKSYNIGVLLKAGNTTLPAKENSCPRYGKIA